ncbi:hypothetical protein CR513_10781, partial [Mucuna pruriens]
MAKNGEGLKLVPNPKEEVKFITLRRGKELKESQQTKKKVAPPKDETPTKAITIDVNDEEIFRKLHINISFVEAITQMPNYVKVLRNIISNKKKLEEFKVIKLIEECSMVVLNKSPPKIKDLEVSLSHLGDRTIIHPLSIEDDILIKVGKLIFPNDFVILDIEEEDEVLIILARPFLTMGRAMINIELNFIVFNSHKTPLPLVSYNCMRALNIFYGETLKNLKPFKEPVKKWFEKHKVGLHTLYNMTVQKRGYIKCTCHIAQWCLQPTWTYRSKTSFNDQRNKK